MNSIRDSTSICFKTLISIYLSFHTFSYRQESDEDKATVAKINSMMCTTVPESELYNRRLWRDQRLAALAKLKRSMK